MRQITHSIERTSPKGAEYLFVGRCTLCGATDLKASDALERCPNSLGISADESLVRAIEGETEL